MSTTLRAMATASAVTQAREHLPGIELEEALSLAADLADVDLVERARRLAASFPGSAAS